MFHQQIILPLSHTHLCFDTKSSHRVISNIQINKSFLLQSLLKYCAIFVNCNLRSSFGYSIFADNMILIAPAVSSKLSKTTLKHADTNICLYIDMYVKDNLPIFVIKKVGLTNYVFNSSSKSKPNDIVRDVIIEDKHFNMSKYAFFNLEKYYI